MNADHTPLTEPTAVAASGGVDLPPATPREVLDIFVASLQPRCLRLRYRLRGQDPKRRAVRDPGRLRVHIASAVTPA